MLLLTAILLALWSVAGPYMLGCVLCIHSVYKYFMNECHFWPSVLILALAGPILWALMLVSGIIWIANKGWKK